MLLPSAKRSRPLIRRKTQYERRFAEPFKGPVIPFGSMMEYQPVSAKDQSRLHQFGKKVLPEIFFGYALFAERIWKGDILVADIEEGVGNDGSEFSSATKWRIPVVQQRTDATRAVPESSEEDRASTVTACTGRDAIQHWAHGTRTLEKTFEQRDTPNQAVDRIVNGKARAWSIHHLSRFDQAGTGDGGGSRATQTREDLAE